MSIIEAGARGGAIAILLLFAALALRDGRNAAARYAALFAAGVASALICFTPPLVLDPALWLLPLRVLAFGNPAVFWALATALFDDAFAFSRRHVMAWFALVGLGFWAVYGDAAPRPFVAANALSLICLALSLWPVIAGRRDDLVEARRRMRPIFVTSVGAFIAAIIVGGTLLRGGLDYPVFGYINAFGTWAIAMTFALFLLSLSPSTMFTVALAAQQQPKAQSAAPACPPDDPRDAQLLAALKHQLEEDRAYREEALNIAVLAHRLGVPEYRLRRLINQRLGFRNFSTFLNSYRLADAMIWLADPDQSDVPILTVGLDAGFQSIGSFNRAFKGLTGVTPSEFRRARLADAARERARR